MSTCEGTAAALQSREQTEREREKEKMTTLLTQAWLRFGFKHHMEREEDNKTLPLGFGPVEADMRRRAATVEKDRCCELEERTINSLRSGER